MKSKDESIRFDFEIEVDEATMKKAIEEFDRLVKEGNHSLVRIVVSRHWASEGLWVEAFIEEPTKLSYADTVTKEWKKTNRRCKKR